MRVLPLYQHYLLEEDGRATSLKMPAVPRDKPLLTSKPPPCFRLKIGKYEGLEVSRNQKAHTAHTDPGGRAAVPAWRAQPPNPGIKQTTNIILLLCFPPIMLTTAGDKKGTGKGKDSCNQAFSAAQRDWGITTPTSAQQEAGLLTHLCTPPGLHTQIQLSDLSLLFSVERHSQIWGLQSNS